MHRLLVVSWVVALTATACSGVASTPADTSGTTASVTTSSTAPADTSSSQPTSTTTPGSSTTDGVSPTTTTPEGMPIDLWVPHPGEGPVIGVVGVRYDDVLNLRAGPGTGSVVVATLDPLQDGIVGTGNGWQMPSGAVWWEVEVDGIVGWANQSFLSRMGDVLDLTSEVVAAIGLIPTAATMEELALTVACVHDPESEDCGSAPVVVVAPTVADLGEITVDVLGLADDSTAGYRLHVFGEPVDGDGFSLTAVERTLLCTRGVDDGLCI